MSKRSIQTGSAATRALWVVLVLVIAGLAATPLLIEEDDGRPVSSSLLDAKAVLRSDGTEFAFTVRRPSRIRIRVTLPTELEGTARVGPAAPAKKRDIAYAPRKDHELVFEVKGDTGTPVEQTVMAVGPYFVRIDPIPTAMGEMDAMVHVVVTAEAIR